MLKRMLGYRVSMFGGVLSGLAYFFKLPVGLVRLLFIVALFPFSLIAIIAYVLAWMLLPKTHISKEDFDNVIKGKGLSSYHFNRDESVKEVKVIEIKEIDMETKNSKSFNE